MAACRLCNGALVLHEEPGEEGDEEMSFPDDVELLCKCHFHWQCLLDQSSRILSDFKCPVCNSSVIPTEAGASSSSLPAQPQNLPTTYTNEGGVQQGLDILPDLKEEAYIIENPEARPARALQLMCAKGDVTGTLDLLHKVSREMDELQIARLLRYQDPFAAGATALHLAVENFREESAWLLLWIASQLPADEFPEAARKDAESVSLQRSMAAIGDDIRLLRNEAGQTAGDVARTLGIIWAPFIQTGVLDP